MIVSRNKMPLKTYESQVEGGIRIRRTKVSKSPFALSPSEATHILGVSQETIDEARHWREDTVLDDTLLLNLAHEVIEKPAYGWREPGKRSLTVDQRTGNTRYVFRAASGAYRAMVLSSTR